MIVRVCLYGPIVMLGAGLGVFLGFCALINRIPD